MGKGPQGQPIYAYPGEPGYDYEVGGLSYSQRVPANLLGAEAKAVRNHVDTVNDRLMLAKMNEATGAMQMPVGAQREIFPKTTNQDFHNDDVFNKA